VRHQRKMAEAMCMRHRTGNQMLKREEVMRALLDFWRDDLFDHGEIDYRNLSDNIIGSDKFIGWLFSV